MPRNSTIVVKSVFKNEDEEIRKKEFTRLIVELINQKERNKNRIL